MDSTYISILINQCLIGILVILAQVSLMLNMILVYKVLKKVENIEKYCIQCCGCLDSVRTPENEGSEVETGLKSQEDSDSVEAKSE